MNSEKDIPKKYRLRPDYTNKFNPEKVKRIIYPILKDFFKDVKYQSEQVPTITKDLGNKIRDTLTDSQDLSYDRYKIIVNVFIGEQRGQGVKFGCRCFWDEDTDNYCSEVFTKEDLFCVVTVFGVYNY